MSKKIHVLELVVLIYCMSQITIGIGTLIINEQYYEPFQQKLLIMGEITDMDYFNMTFSNDVNFNILTDNSDITRHYYNLTINDILSNSLKYISLDDYCINKWNIELGNIICVWRNAPFIEIIDNCWCI